MDKRRDAPETPANPEPEADAVEQAPAADSGAEPATVNQKEPEGPWLPRLRAPLAGFRRRFSVR